jgi:hypothetical protein
MADPDATKVNEYLVVAHTRVDPVALKDAAGNVREIYSVYTQDIKTKVLVEDYKEANYRLLAEAQRIRNYAAYFTRSQHPLDFSMVGQRDTMINSGLPFISAIFDGTTHLPFTDGGFGKTSALTTRYGPDRGLTPPYDKFHSKESMVAWIADLNERLKLTGRMLEAVPRGSACDAAINCVGESFWTGEGKDRFLACWRAIDSIAKGDHPKVKAIGFEQIQDSLDKRLKDKLDEEALKSLRSLRHAAAHSSPSQDNYPLYHTRLREIYTIAREATDSMITETTGAKKELKWNPEGWEHR